MRDDTEFEEFTVEAVVPGTGGFELRHGGGWCLFVPNKDALPLPVPGERGRMYGKGTGYPVRGVVIGERVYWYETKAEQDARFKRETEEKDRQDREKWDASWPETRERIARLPDPLKARMDLFLSGEGWGPRFGFYELFCCEEAVVIAGALKTPEAVRSFGKADPKEQSARIPALKYDAHSGNTFGASVRLAWWLVSKPEAVPKEHGALCPLVGCADYGCYALRKEPR